MKKNQHTQNKSSEEQKIFGLQEKIKKAAQENPDLTYDFISKMLEAKEESRLGNFKPYEFNPMLTIKLSRLN